MGRFSPSVERIQLPPSQLAGGKLVLQWADAPTLSSSSVRPGIRHSSDYLLARVTRGVESLPEQQVGIELRRLAPANWSHAINHHLLQSLLLRREIERQRPVEQARVILPKGIPRYITNLYTLFGFQPLIADLPVRGRIGEFYEEPFSCHRAVMTDLVEELVHDSPIAKRLFQSGIDLPKKVFISRKDTRRVLNEPEVERFLNGQGYVKIFPETLKIEEQFALFAGATHVVGVHGAGLGPFAYRPRHRPCVFVEILSPGHMTDFYRFIAHQIGARWVGVRGCLWPSLVADAHAFDAPFKRHSLSDFRVDVSSLGAALEIAESPG